MPNDVILALQKDVIIQVGSPAACRQKTCPRGIIIRPVLIPAARIENDILLRAAGFRDNWVVRGRSPADQLIVITEGKTGSLIRNMIDQSGDRSVLNGIPAIDSMPIAVCHNRRIHSHRVLSDAAQRGKTTMGWFYGFKLHLIVNDQGELLAFRFTPGNTDDREPVPEMTKDLFGKLFGLLFTDGVQLITRLRRNMKSKLMPVFDKVMLRKRAIIETIHDQLKNISQIEHTRHRSPANFLVNVIAALIAYTHKEKKLTKGDREIRLNSGYKILSIPKKRDGSAVRRGNRSTGSTYFINLKTAQ